MEFSDITKDGEPWEAAVFLPRRDDLLAMGIDFDGPDGLVPKQCVGKYPAANACKKMESSELVQLMGSLMRVHARRRIMGHYTASLRPVDDRPILPKGYTSRFESRESPNHGRSSPRPCLLPERDSNTHGQGF